MDAQQLKEGIESITPEILSKFREVMHMYFRLTMEASQELYNTYAMKGWKCSQEEQDMISSMSLATQEQYDNCDKMLDDMLNNPEGLAQLMDNMQRFIKQVD